MNRESGVFVYNLTDGVQIAGVSGGSWEEFRELLSKVSPTEKLVVSPELITDTNGSDEEIVMRREKIESRVAEMIDFSSSRPVTTFLLGTPLFVNPRKPRNSLLFIKNGEIVGCVNKRCGATREENECFEMVSEERPFLIPGTNTAVLICADLALAAFYAGKIDKETRDRCLELGGKKHLVGREVSFLPETATSLVVVSCWGVGGQWMVEGKEDEYYKMQLKILLGD